MPHGSSCNCPTAGGRPPRPPGPTCPPIPSRRPRAARCCWPTPCRRWPGCASDSGPPDRPVDGRRRDARRLLGPAAGRRPRAVRPAPVPARAPGRPHPRHRGGRVMPTDPKIRTDHLRRQAVVYVRQSTPHQVRGNRESTVRQYALADRAKALGLAGRGRADDRRGPGAVRGPLRPPRRVQEAAGRDRGRPGRAGAGPGGLPAGPLVGRLAPAGRDLRRSPRRCWPTSPPSTTRGTPTTGSSSG